MDAFFKTIGMIASGVCFSVGGAALYVAYRVALCCLRRRLGVAKLRELYVEPPTTTF